MTKKEMFIRLTKTLGWKYLDKHSSLLGLFVSDQEKSFITLPTGVSLTIFYVTNIQAK